MLSDLACIGFPVRSEAEFVTHMTTALRFGERLDVSEGSYFRLDPGEGVELWAQTDTEGTFVGITPHFSGTARVRIDLVERVPRDGEGPLEGLFHGRAGDVDFYFDIPDARRIDERELPRAIDLQLAAFGLAVQAVASGAAVDLFEPVLVVPSEDPAEGYELLVTPAGDPVPGASPHAAIAGEVLEHRVLTNPNTRVEFLWIRLRTRIGEVDAVAGLDGVEGRIEDGGSVSGLFRLSGRLTQAESQAPSDRSEGKAGWRRIFGGRR